MFNVRSFKSITFFIVASAFIVSSVATVQAAPIERIFLLATGSTGGTFYRVGVGL
jgi:TRAP-type uncharacterized transport system substrate-binding protein